MGFRHFSQRNASRFEIQEATIDQIQQAILKKQITTQGVVEAYLKRIQAYNGTCVNEPQGILGPITPIAHARQINALSTLNLRPAARAAWGFDARKARSLTDKADDAANMPDALETAAAQDRQFARTGRLVGPLHGVVLAIKDQYDTFDMRTTSGADADYANDRPPDDATFVKRLRDAGAIILAKANLAEYAVDGARSSFGGTFCNPYDTEREPGMSSAGSATAVAANLVTCAIGEETVVSIRWPASVNSLVGLAPTQELVSRDGMIGSGLVMRVGPICRTVQDTARVLDAFAGYDPKDELTVFSVGRTPAKPYASFAGARRLDGVRIGVLREYMRKSLLAKADEESIELVETAIADLRALGATIVDPGPEGELFTRVHRSIRAGAAELGVRAAVPAAVSRPTPPAGRRRSASRRCSSCRQDPTRVPRQLSLRTLNARRVRPGRRRQVHDQPLPARARRREHQEQRRSDHQGAVLSGPELPGSQAGARAGRTRDGAGHRRRACRGVSPLQTMLLQCMQEQRLDALVSPMSTVPPRKLTVAARAGVERPHADRVVADRSAGISGDHRTGRLHDDGLGSRAPTASGTRLVGPVAAALPVGVDFIARPFDEPLLFRIASAYEAATKHRKPPADFGALR